MTVETLQKLADAIKNNESYLSTLSSKDLEEIFFESDKNNYTPFQYACQYGSVEILEALINILGTQLYEIIQLQKPLGWKPTSLTELAFSAVKRGDKNLALTCLKLGVDCCSTDYSGNTLLHHAMMADHRDIASALLEEGIDEHLKNNDDKTAIDIVDPMLAAWFIQKSRRIRLRQLLDLQREVKILRDQLKSYATELTSKKSCESS